MSKSKAAVEKRMLNINANVDNSPYDGTSNKVAEFLTKKEQTKLFREFLNKRRIEEKHKYRMKQSANQLLVDHSEEEMDCEEDYNDEYNNEDEYYDDFESKR